MRTIVAAALLAALAAWLAWPPPAPWRPLQAFETVQVVAFGDVDVPSNLQAAGGRVLAARTLELVFRRATNAREISLAGPSGSFRLFLGDKGPALSVSRTELKLEGVDPPAQAAAPDGLERGTVTLRWREDEVLALVDGEVLLRGAWSGGAPAGRAGARAMGQSSFHELALRSDEGEQVLRDTGGDEMSWRPIWAAAAVLLLVPSLVALWRVRVRGERRGRFLAGLSLAGLLVAPGFSLWQHNRDRVRPPDVSCATAPWQWTVPTRVELFDPLLGPGRVDGDFDLSATITLDEASVVDLLVRGAPVDRDRGVVVSLSSDPRLSSGLALNLSTDWIEERAPAGLATLPAGRPLLVKVEAEGSEVRASVDGEPLGTLRDLDLRAGRTALAALSGGATLESLSLAPRGAPRDLVGLLWAGIALAVLTAVAGWGILAWLLRSTTEAGLVVAPLAAACWPVAPPALVVAAGAVTALLALVVARRLRLATLLAGAAMGALGFRVLSEEQPPYSPTALNDLRLVDMHGGPVPQEYLWARHPLCRRFSDFVRDQRFRSGGVTPARTPGVPWRFVALGSSSTYGYGLGAEQGWPAQLEERFRGQAEVINAGTLGATAERLRSILEGVLVKLEPDLVIIDLSFNDHSFGPILDERAHFARFAGEGVDRLDQLGEWWRSMRVGPAWKDYFGALTAGEEPDPEDRERFEVEPTTRFADSLRDLVRVAQEGGARVLLVAEPARPGLGHPTLPPYRETVKAVGAELGVPVVDPQAALDAEGPEVFIDAVHPTEEGHRVLSGEIFRVIAREGVLRGPR